MLTPAYLLRFDFQFWKILKTCFRFVRNQNSKKRYFLSKIIFVSVMSLVCVQGQSYKIKVWFIGYKSSTTAVQGSPPKNRTLLISMHSRLFHLTWPVGRLRCILRNPRQTQPQNTINTQQNDFNIRLNSNWSAQKEQRFLQCIA